MRNLFLALVVAWPSSMPANAVVFQFAGTVPNSYIYDEFTGDSLDITNAPVTATLTLNTFVPTNDGGYYSGDLEYGYNGYDMATVHVELGENYSWLDPDAVGYDWLSGVPHFQTDIIVDAGRIVSFSHSSRIDTWGEDIIGGVTLSGSSTEWTFAPYGTGGFSATLNPGYVLPIQNMDLVTHGDLQQVHWNYFAVDSLSTVGVTNVPEPFEWALLIVGFVLVGLSVRLRSLAVPITRLS
jgi:hypothetical protein